MWACTLEKNIVRIRRENPMLPSGVDHPFLRSGVAVFMKLVKIFQLSPTVHYDVDNGWISITGENSSLRLILELDKTGKFIVLIQGEHSKEFHRILLRQLEKCGVVFRKNFSSDSSSCHATIPSY